jgi:hypothetical protein
MRQAAVSNHESASLDSRLGVEFAGESLLRCLDTWEIFPPEQQGEDYIHSAMLTSQRFHRIMHYSEASL